MALERNEADQPLKIYLDVCCLNRPLDDWSQERVRLEGETVLSILERIRAGQWQLISSEAIAVELGRMRNLEKKANILNFLRLAAATIEIDAEIDQRSQQLEVLGVGLYDSFHLACTEAVRLMYFCLLTIACSKRLSEIEIY
jgi:hypothetical protein